LDGGELFDRIVEKHTYTEKEARDVCSIIFDAVNHCHMHRITHRDLKPENLLLLSRDNDTNLKIADFGFAKMTPSEDSLTTFCGSPMFVSPEILNKKPYGTNTDMWSIGVR
jgi:serine/threonine protein kinase